MEPAPGSQSSTVADEEFCRRLKSYETRMHPNYDLRFSGRELVLRENGKPILNWPAVSGQAGKQSPDFKRSAIKDLCRKATISSRSVACKSMTRSAACRKRSAPLARGNGPAASVHGVVTGFG
jgi:hypothetical protein